MLYLCDYCDCVFLQSQTWLFPVDFTETSHLRTVLGRPDMQALVFHQNANNIICNIQGNIIVVLIGEKKIADESTCPPHFSIILITMAEIKGNMLYNDRCLLSGVTVLLLFVSLRPRVAHLDGRNTLVFESSSRRWIWALRRGTFLCLVLWFIHSHHMSLEVVFGRPRVLICAMLRHTVASHMRRSPVWRTEGWIVQKINVGHNIVAQT